ncbi:MAG: NIPSNAP family protein [Dehalococcoidia bacterium]|nr:NIPSNAP family protein [Dehalococcoidia bacterium]
MLYELRIYEILPGRTDALHRRFANVTNKLFEKHGFRVAGYFEPAVGDNNQLTYILQWDDMAHREKAFGAFQADPEWQTARTASEEDGRIVARITTSFLKPTDYSPMQ